MNKKIALVTLIKNSISIASEGKLALLHHVKQMTDEEVEKLGAYFRAEREFVLANTERIVGNVKTITETLLSASSNSDQVYFGSAKP